MSQSLARILLHLVFSTKERRRVFLVEEMRSGVAGYITGILKNLGSPVLRIGVVTDHMHVLYLQSRTATVADTVAAAKRESSVWVKDQPWARMNADFAQFGWQSGYGVFSVSDSKVDDVSRYIDGQMEHHRRTTFEDEYRKFLKRHNVPFDERYVWD